MDKAADLKPRWPRSPRLSRHHHSDRQAKQVPGGIKKWQRFSKKMHDASKISSSGRRQGSHPIKALGEEATEDLHKCHDFSRWIVADTRATEITRRRMGGPAAVTPHFPSACSRLLRA